MTKMNLEASARAGSVAHMIRGGRLVKRKGQVLSFAPHVGQLCSVSCGALAAGLALGVSLLSAAPASAGTCDPLTPPFDLNGATVTCSGPADQANDVTQEIVGQQLTVTTAPGFGISTSAADGLSLTVGSGYNSGLTFVDTNTIASQITAAETAIDAYAVGTSSIATNATIKGGTYGIKFAVGSGGSLTINATGSVEGTTYDGINAALTGEARDMTVRAADVIGGRTGIDVVNKAYGNTVVESSNSVTAINGIGIIVNNENPRTENLTIDVVNVIGKTGGISAYNNGNGTTIVTATGLVGGTAADGYTTADGIRIFNTAIGNTAIPAGQTAAPVIGMQVSAHDVNGGVNGIFADHNGAGGLVITADGTVNGRSADGIYADNSTAGTYLSVTATGPVFGGGNGVYADNDGTGATLITTTDAVEGLDGRGINVLNGATATDLTINAFGTVKGGSDGVFASNNGKGATSITATGDVTGDGSSGIFAINLGADTTDLTIEARGTVTAADYGIAADNRGVGATLITATGAVTGGGQAGIGAFNDASATDLTVDVVDVAGGVTGIIALNNGTGTTVVTATGLVGGTAVDGYTTADGIHVANSALGNTVAPAGQTTAPLIGMQVSAHDVNGGVNGIFADHNGAGGLVITTDGAVNGRSADGINANNFTLGTYLSVTTAAVTGGVNGIFAKNLGTSATLVSAGGAVTGGTRDGIYADTEGANLTISASAVTGGRNGIYASNDGSGFTLVTASGAVTGSDEDGIYVTNFIGTTDLTIIADAVTGGQHGVYASNEGSGDTTITTNGVVTGTAANGINSSSDAGSTLIIANALVTGGNHGIYADSDFDGVNLTIAANAVTGGVTGIYARNFGTGATLVTASGVVKGATYSGINAQNGLINQNVTGGTDLTIDVETDVKGGTSGIFAVNNGTGVTLINTTGPNLLGGGTVTGYAGNGIDVLNGANAADLIIQTASVTGSLNGIKAVNKSDSGGSTSITSTGDVLGEAEDGIYALNEVDTTDLTIVANNVEGGANGIFAENNGNGATSITTSGEVKTSEVTTGTVFGDGIFVNAYGTDLTVTATGSVTGSNNGIFANNGGSGSTSITAEGAVTGERGDGIYGYNDTTADNLEIAATSVVTGNDYGIYAKNLGRGATNVTASSVVEGLSNDGIYTYNSVGTTDLTIVANVVTGDNDGVDVRNEGSGNTSVTTNGLVTGTEGDGIYVGTEGVGSISITANALVAGEDDGIDVNNIDLSGAVEVTATDVTGGDFGIIVEADGIGATLVKASGTVSGRVRDGVNVSVDDNGTALTVEVNSVTGGRNGVYTDNQGTGATLITASGLVTGGTSGNGIDVFNDASATTLTVNANAVTAGLNGIFAVNNGSGASTVSVSGTIAGGSGVGIDTSTLVGNLTTINIADTAIVGATSGNAIANNEGNSVLNIAANAVVNGSVELDNGSDTANFARNGAIASITLLDGGDNVSSADGFVDTLNLNGGDNFNLVGANTVNWEIININGGTVGFSDAAILAETINVNNGGTLDGTNNLVATANVNIAGGGALTVGNADGTGVTRITGNLANAGIVSLRGRTAAAGAGDTLNVGGNYAGAGGQVALDTVLNGDNSLTDLLNVTGNVTGGSVIAINNAGGVGGFTTGDGIRIVRVGGTSVQDGFRLLDDVEAGAFRYDLFLGGITDPDDQDWYLRTVGLSDVAATTLSFARLSDDIAMTFLGTLHERVGEQEHLAKRGYQSGGVSGIWGRFIGKGFREKLTSPTLGDVKSTGSITGLQMGLDFVRNVKADGSATFVGAYSGYADGSSTDKNIFQGVSRKSGTSDSKGWLAGLYGTHYASAGWYANVVLQANWVDASANGRNGAVLKTDGRTYLSSFELGQSLKLADRLAFEPQVQLIYGDTQFDAATDSNGTESRVGIESSLIGRAGFRLKTTKSEKYNAEGGLFSGYLKANLWHNFSGADVELFSAGQPVGGFEPKKTWVDVGLGTTLTVAKNTEIYFDADVEFGLDIKNTAGRGNVGLRFNW